MNYQDTFWVCYVTFGFRVVLTQHRWRSLAVFTIGPKEPKTAKNRHFLIRMHGFENIYWFRGVLVFTERIWNWNSLLHLLLKSLDFNFDFLNQKSPEIALLETLLVSHMPSDQWRHETKFFYLQSKLLR